MSNEFITLTEAAELTGLSLYKIRQMINSGILKSRKELIELKDGYGYTYRHLVRVLPVEQLDIIEHYLRGKDTIAHARSLHKITDMPVTDFMDAREEALYSELEFIGKMRNYLERHGY